MADGNFDMAHLPDGLSEADLLDWIEADSRARASATDGSPLGRVQRAIAADPGLGAALEAMRIDRAALGSLETSQPPAWIAQAVLEEHERQSLLALSDMAAGRPRSQGEDFDDEPFSLSAMPGWFRPALAIAAVLAVAFGAWQLLPTFLPQATPTPQGPVAIDDGGDSIEEPVLEPGPGPVEPDPVRIAEAPEIVQPSPRTLAPSAADVLAARLDMPADQALEFALQGRLLVVVGVERVEVARTAALSVAAQPVDGSWSLAEPSGDLVAALSTPDKARLIGIEAADGPAIAGERGPLGHLEIIFAQTPTVFVAEVSASPEALLSMVEALERFGPSVRVVVADQPMPSAGAMPAPATPEHVLWWEVDASSWRPWASIPVRFIESR